MSLSVDGETYSFAYESRSGVITMSVRPADNRPSPARPLNRSRVTRTETSPTVTCVPTSWPVEDFRDYLRALMNAAGIADYAELSRVSGVSQTQLSNWRRGLSQPSRQALKKLVMPLGLKSPVMLYIAAGIDAQEDLELDAAPDFTVLPKPFQDLREVYEQLKLVGQEDMVLSSIRVLVDGLKAQVRGSEGGQPSGRRRRAG